MQYDKWSMCIAQTKSLRTLSDSLCLPASDLLKISEGNKESINNLERKNSCNNLARYWFHSDCALRTLVNLNLNVMGSSDTKKSQDMRALGWN